jgi:hypothetical protein
MCSAFSAFLFFFFAIAKTSKFREKERNPKERKRKSAYLNLKKNSWPWGYNYNGPKCQTFRSLSSFRSVTLLDTLPTKPTLNFNMALGYI